MLKYLRFHRSCDVAFGVFMVSWFVARHVLFLMVVWSIYVTLPAMIPFTCYNVNTGAQAEPTWYSESILHNMLQPFLHPADPICWNTGMQNTFLGTLLTLQVITLIWFGMILRVAIKVIKGNNADDSRSDEEDEEMEADERILESIETAGENMTEKGYSESARFIEEDVGVNAINFKGRASPARRIRKGPASASGVTLPGHSDRKELLGRIGCDKST